MKRDLACAALLLGLAVIFWIAQEEYTEPVDGALPRFVLVVLAVLGLVIGTAALVRGRGTNGEASADATADPELAGVAAMRGTTSRAGEPAAPETADPTTRAGGSGSPDSGADTSDEDADAETTGTSTVDWRILTAAILLLVGWGAAFGLFGLTLSGVVAFVATAVLVNRGITTTRRLVVDVAVAVGFVLLCFFVFTRVLYVPIPVSEVLGI
ncbi:hypothetical protein F4561_003820 [Lipingzhangella halophila]|uniref:DUF1468 domain-containing protein n=1 Tax=Lipingzhangella halophila TaxID=1783352 RepID=A0A7W7W4R1_9ACTN|nr:tripartite tricarboxylate transporter TctB family protein [Lipingzhangella halophila]MBB4933000.1 hypothetical protein [Lipingzhangella halophila]